MKSLTVIGATGKLAVPIIFELLKKEVTVTAVVRNYEKAKNFLPSSVKIVEADLKDKGSLREAFRHTNYLYINLSTVDTESDFIPEIHGIYNILDVLNRSKIKQIIKISALGAKYPDFHVTNKALPNNKARVLGQSAIVKSGIPYTIFHPTWFLNSLFWFVNNKSLEILGLHPHSMYWTNTKDFSNWVYSAIGNPIALNKEYCVQGKNGYTFREVAEMFCSAHKPVLNLKELDINPKMGSFGEFMHYFTQFTEHFVSDSLYQDLGDTLISTENFIKEMLMY